MCATCRLDSPTHNQYIQHNLTSLSGVTILTTLPLKHMYTHDPAMTRTKHGQRSGVSTLTPPPTHTAMTRTKHGQRSGVSTLTPPPTHTAMTRTKHGQRSGVSTLTPPPTHTAMTRTKHGQRSGVSTLTPPPTHVHTVYSARYHTIYLVSATLEDTEE